MHLVANNAPQEQLIACQNNATHAQNALQDTLQQVLETQAVLVAVLDIFKVPQEHQAAPYVLVENIVLVQVIQKAIIVRADMFAQPEQEHQLLSALAEGIPQVLLRYLLIACHAQVILTVLLEHVVAHHVELREVMNAGEVQIQTGHIADVGLLQAKHVCVQVAALTVVMESAQM